MRSIFLLFIGAVLGVVGFVYAILHIDWTRKIIIDGTVKVVGDEFYDTQTRSKTVPFRTYRDFSPSRASQYRATAAGISPRDRLVTAFVQNHDETLHILHTMTNLVEEYGFFTVSDLRSALGLQTRFTDSKYGWTTVDDVLQFDKSEVNNGWRLSTKKPAIAIN